MHLLRGFNSKHPKTWNESFPYLLFSFNQTIHGSTLKSPFKICLGYLPHNTFDLAFAVESETRSGKTKEKVEKARSFQEQISKIYNAIKVWSKKSQVKYKARPDKH